VEVLNHIDIGIKKYEYDKLKDNRWARGVYIELGEQMKILIGIADKGSKEYLMQLGVVHYLIRNLEAYLTLVKVSP
jgi:hypothetical protein